MELSCYNRYNVEMRFIQISVLLAKFAFCIERVGLFNGIKSFTIRPGFLTFWSRGVSKHHCAMMCITSADCVSLAYGLSVCELFFVDYRYCFFPLPAFTAYCIALISH